MNQKIRDSIEKKHPMHWEYHPPSDDPWAPANQQVETFALVATTELRENGNHRERVNYRSKSRARAIALNLELQLEGVEIKPPQRMNHYK